MKIIKKYWRELVCLFLVALFVYLPLLWLYRPPQNAGMNFLLSIALIADGILLVLIFRYLWKNKWKQGLLHGVKAMLRGASRFLIRILNKWNPYAGKTQVLSGKTMLVIGHDAGFALKKGKNRKMPKWKQLQTDRERLRYLYRQMITARIHSGRIIHASDTPSELKLRSENTESEEELFDLYIRLRYDERNDFTAERVCELKDELNLK